MNVDETNETMERVGFETLILGTSMTGAYSDVRTHITYWQGSSGFVSRPSTFNESVQNVKMENNIGVPTLRKAIVMAGGFGSRMKELTKNKPKPMLPLQGKPILEYTLDLCKLHGINQVAMTTHYFGEQISKHFADGKSYDIDIVYFHEDTPLGTGGALKLHKDWLNEPFMMCNADELKDIDLTKMFEQHIASGASVTLALTQVADPTQYGVVDISGIHIKRFFEKPKIEDAPSNLISAGLYIINPDVIDILPNGFTMVEKDLFPILAAQGRLCGFEFKGQWFDTGTLERYTTAEGQWRGFIESAAKKAGKGEQ